MLRIGTATALTLAVVSAAGLVEDSEQPIDVQADEGSCDPNSSVCVLTGTVRIQQGTLRLEANKVTLSNQGGQIERIVAEGRTGEPARLRQRLNPSEPFANASAQRIDYAVGEGRVELRGDAHLSQNDREFSGDILFWDTREGRVHAPSGVRLQWHPEQRQAGS